MPDPVRPDWIALDWGTTNLRAWAMDDSGAVLDAAQSDAGMGRLTPDAFEPALLRTIGHWDLPERCEILACGMVGARQGWAEAPYGAVPCPPTGPAPVTAPTADPRLHVRILPGLSQAAPPDVMRGEETQIAGFLAGDAGFDGTLCLPGTHTKWLQISAGEIVSFRTAMTGELFALLKGQSVLRHSMGEGWDAEAFDAALLDALSRPEALAARLFGLRAGALVAGLAPDAASARLSGLLIGAELAAMKPYWLGAEVVLIGAPKLSQLYAAGLAAQGVSPRNVAADDLTRAGLAAARAHWKDRS